MQRPIDHTHDPFLRSWVTSANEADGDFPIQNLPYGVFRRRGESAGAIGAAIGDQVLDLRECCVRGVLDALPEELQDACKAPVLNALMALGPKPAQRLRHELVDLLRTDSRRADPGMLVAMADVGMELPASIGGFTDFYASVFHASRVGGIFRADSPLSANYKHMPVAYHSRTSSIVVSGTPVRRPSGQRLPDGARAPVFEPSAMLDYEAELGVLVGSGNAQGVPIPLDVAEERVFGVCLLNDWSARDLQAWEVQPLGPFLSKNFATTISPWVVTLEALAPFRCGAFPREASDPTPLPYLMSASNERNGGLDIDIEVTLQSAQMRRLGMDPARMSRASLRHMFWTLAQMVAHHASNGCNLRPGDLLGTGTVSGPDDGSCGCLLEMTRRGQLPVSLQSGETRSFLADGDEVMFRGRCRREGFIPIGLGTCRGVVRPTAGESPRRAIGGAV